MSVRISMAICAIVCASLPAAASPASAKLLLKRGWRIRPSAETAENGAALSQPGFQARGWYRATMPSTVLAALVANHVYEDPYVGKNLRSIPGTTYPIGTNFSNVPMPPGSPFRGSWWYRAEFTPPEDYRGRSVQLHFDGINFRSNVWLNGRQIAKSDSMAGAWRLFDFDVTKDIRPGAANALAVEVFPPTPEDLAITFVDWNPAPPDKGMGIWRDVYLTATGPVSIAFPQVITKLDLPRLDQAHLKVTAELKNNTDAAVDGELIGAIEDVNFSTRVRLDPHQTKVVGFSPQQFPQLNFERPRLWWPVFYGAQNLYPLRLEFVSGGAVSDTAETRFGIREVSGELDAQKHVVFKVNGRNVLIRGGGWTFDMMLRQDPERLKAELNYVRNLNLNAIRLEGKMENDEFFRMTDEMGILVIAGWCCCDHWERWRDWDDEDRVVAAASLRDQIRRLRSHPSVLDWMNGSDGPPPPEVEKMYIAILKELEWPNPFQSSATAKATPVTGPSGVKMTGPYEYVAPSYWLLDKSRGGAHGFNTETSPGPAVPPVESLRRMLPEDHLWPVDSYWDYRAGGGEFRNIQVFTEALNARYGPSANVDEFAMKAQLMEYEGERAMFEAFGVRKYAATGVIQWMLNNAWPSVIWHLYDYYLRPAGSYFGTKKACEPLHIQYSYDDRSIAVVNGYNEGFSGLHASARAYDLNMKQFFAREEKLDIAADGVRKVFAIPEAAGATGTWFLDLTLADASGKTVSSNFYWLSKQADVLDWDASTWYHTPTKVFSDLTALNKLPRVELKVTSISEVHGDQGLSRITIANPTANVAFFVNLDLVKPARDPETPGHSILPVLWDENYFPVMPGATREVTAAYSVKDSGSRAPVVEVRGWNVRKASLTSSLRQ